MILKITNKISQSNLTAIEFLRFVKIISALFGVVRNSLQIQHLKVVDETSIIKIHDEQGLYEKFFILDFSWKSQ